MQYAAEDKIKVIPNVVETEVFKYAARESGKSEKIAFTCVAIWKKPKRPDLFFTALQQVSPKLSKPVVLNVVGEGPMMDELLARKWNFIINPVGNVDQKKLAEILKTTDYFLHASDHETFSLVIAEALSSGVPVLASGIGAIPELINENNGLTCENTVEAWSEAIQDLVARQDYDPYKIRELALRFDKVAIGKAFMDLYQDVLESNK
jgi:glycosyltransferase involved in cell wall biosynthesis